MALDAFYNLKDKKQRYILEALSRCLEKINYEELVVNDIVLEADISRGSFYNYFLDKSDAVATLIESKVRDYIEQFKQAVKDSNNSLFVGSLKLYYDKRDILTNEINKSMMRNLKFFIEFGLEVIHSKRNENVVVELVEWLINNTQEGQSKLNTKKKMANILDLIVLLILNTIFSETILKSRSYAHYDDFEYKLKIIRHGIINN